MENRLEMLRNEVDRLIFANRPVGDLKALVREQKIPFELTTTQQANADYIAKLDDSIARA